jgi:hypothetical protein
MMFFIGGRIVRILHNLPSTIFLSASVLKTALSLVHVHAATGTQRQAPCDEASETEGHRCDRIGDVSLPRCQTRAGGRLGYGRRFESSGVYFTAQLLAHQKTIGGDTETRVVMEAAPIASLIMMQSKLGFQILVIALDAPATHGGRHEALQ